MILTDELLPDMRGVKETAARFGMPVHFVRQAALSGAVVSVRAGKKKLYINQKSFCDYLNGGNNGKEK